MVKLEMVYCFNHITQNFAGLLSVFFPMKLQFLKGVPHFQTEPFVQKQGISKHHEHFDVCSQGNVDKPVDCNGFYGFSILSQNHAQNW